jgi:hypothetical protein
MRYLVQRIEWVTTGWKGTCPDFRNKVDAMAYPNEMRGKSISENKQNCIGCSEANAFSEWNWGIYPAGTSPNTESISKGDVILLISCDPRRSLSNNQVYYCVGLGFVDKYEKYKMDNNFNNNLICDSANSVSFVYPDCLIEYPYGKEGYPKTGMVCHTSIDKSQLIFLMEKAYKIHLEKSFSIEANKINNLMKIINNHNISDESLIKKNGGQMSLNIDWLNVAGLNPETMIIEDTKKANEFISKVIDSNPGRIAFLPVKPDWNESKKVFGYYNPLTGLFYPTDGLNVLLNAFRSLISGSKDKKHFIILDEMNLARVEYYLSDILSLMENMWKVRVEDKNIKIDGVEKTRIHPFEKCILSKIPEMESFKNNEYYKKYLQINNEGNLEWRNNYNEKICQENKEYCENCYYNRLLIIN